MAEFNTPLLAFNRGLVSPIALARVDLKRVALSAEIMANWMPRSLGSMSFRPGLEMIGETYGSYKAKSIPFIFSNSDTASIEATDLAFRVRVKDKIISRPSVSSAVTNPFFTSDLSDWTDADESGATSEFVTGGYMGLTGTKYNAAIRRQTVTVAAADLNKEHGFRVVVHRGTVTFKLGSTSTNSEYLLATLGVGTHSLSITPTGTSVFIEVSNRTQFRALVNSINVETEGDMILPSPYREDDLKYLRYSQSGDIIFIACKGYQQRKIERRSTRSWSSVVYETDDGPFRVQNVSKIRLTPSATTGDITLTASQSLFDSGHVGALYRMTSVGQKVSATLNGEGQFTNSIRVVGVDNSRVFTILITGTWTATITLQRSIGEEGSWTDVTTYTTNQASVSFDDGLDNQIVYYRIGIDTGDYTSGDAACTLTYSGGGITGIVRITSYTSGISVGASVLKDLGQTTATEDWSESIWSDYRGFPSAVRFYEGRLFWFGKDWVIGSVSDSFYSFDDETEGDSGPIIRSIGQGPVDFINFALDLQRLIIGTEGAEVSARSTSFDEPLTPTNFNIKDPSTQGSANVAAVKIDSRGVYIQKAGKAVYELAYDFNVNDYSSINLTILNPDLGKPGFIHIAAQRQPDTRIHAVRSDGTAAVLVYDPAEDVKCWVNVETDGEIEDCFVLPGTDEDAVYYIVKRDVAGEERRYLEKWAMESECIGGLQNRQADSFAVYEGTPISTLSELWHLEDEDVVVWADGVCLNDSDGDIRIFTVINGRLELLDEDGASMTASQIVVGRYYEAQYKNAKIVFAPLESVLVQDQTVKELGLLLSNTHPKGLLYGGSLEKNDTTGAYEDLDEIPDIVNTKPIDQDTIISSLDLDAFTFPSVDPDPDSRICLVARAPRPVTVMAAIPRVEV